MKNPFAYILICSMVLLACGESEEDIFSKLEKVADTEIADFFPFYDLSYYYENPYMIWGNRTTDDVGMKVYIGADEKGEFLIVFIYYWNTIGSAKYSFWYKDGQRVKTSHDYPPYDLNLRRK